MLYAGLDLSRKRLNFHLLDASGALAVHEREQLIGRLRHALERGLDGVALAANEGGAAAAVVVVVIVLSKTASIAGSSAAAIVGPVSFREDVPQPKAYSAGVVERRVSQQASAVDCDQRGWPANVCDSDLGHALAGSGRLAAHTAAWSVAHDSA